MSLEVQAYHPLSSISAPEHGQVVVHHAVKLPSSSSSVQSHLPDLFYVGLTHSYSVCLQFLSIFGPLPTSLSSHNVCHLCPLLGNFAIVYSSPRSRSVSTLAQPPHDVAPIPSCPSAALEHDMDHRSVRSHSTFPRSNRGVCLI